MSQPPVLTDGMQLLLRPAAHIVVAFVLFTTPLLYLPAARAEVAATVWQRASGVSGTVTHLVSAGEGASTMYASLASGGVLRSDDGGKNWSPANVGLPTGTLGRIDVHALAVDPTNERRAYTAVASGGDAAIYRTSDGGRSWFLAGRGFRGDKTDALAVTPDGSLIYAAIGGRLFVGAASGGDWVQQAVWSQQQVQALAFDREDATIVYTLAGGRLLVSQDGGMTWSDNLLPPPFAATALAVAPQGRLVVATRLGVFAGLDRGATWMPLGSPSAPGPMTSLTWDKMHPDVGYAANRDDVFMTVDGGRTWFGLAKGLVAPGIRSLAEQGSGRIAAATGNGVWWVQVARPPAPTATATPTGAPTATASPTAPATPSPSASPSPSSTLPATPMPEHTATPSPTSSSTPSPSPSATSPARSSPVATPTPAPPTATALPEPSPTPAPVRPPTPTPEPPKPTPVPPTPTLPPPPTATPRR